MIPFDSQVTAQRVIILDELGKVGGVITQSDIARLLYANLPKLGLLPPLRQFLGLLFRLESGFMVSCVRLHSESLPNPCYSPNPPQLSAILSTPHCHSIDH